MVQSLRDDFSITILDFSREDAGLTGAYEKKEDFDTRRYELISTSNKKSSKIWCLQLGLCNSTRMLKSENVVQFYASNAIYGMTGDVIVGIQDFICSSLETFYQDEDLKAKLIVGKFMEYHTTSSSTPGLAMKVISDLRGHSSLFFTETEIQAVKKAYGDLTDLELSHMIPVSAIVTTYAFLEAMDNLPTGWYQGNRAVQSSGGVKYAQLKVIFGQYRQIVSRSSSVKDIGTLELLLSSIKPESLTLPTPEAIDESNLRQDVKVMKISALKKKIKGAIEDAIGDEQVLQYIEDV